MAANELKLQHIDCIFCGTSATSEVVIRENGYDGRQCHSCRLIFISPRPGAERIAALYGHDEAHVPAGSHLASGFSKRLYARHSLRILRKHGADGDLLEVGAGAGFFLDEARKQGFNPFAIEFNAIQAAHISDVLRIPCARAPLAKAPFAGQAFDVIYHCDVLSHFHDPIGEFKSFHDALRDGGLLMFETGNLGDVDQRYFKNITLFQYPDHLFFFSGQNIAQILEATGFELLKVYRYSTLPDLVTTRVRKGIRNLVRGIRDRSPGKAAAGARPARQGKPFSAVGSGPTGPVSGWIKVVDQFLNYLLRYGAGSWMPKGHAPQTLIVVARKR